MTVFWQRNNLHATLAPKSYCLIEGMYINQVSHDNTVNPVCNDHLYNKIYYLWFIQ